MDTGLTNDVVYYYVVTAVDSSGNESLLSAEVNATPEDVTPPAAPTTLAAVAGENLVTLDWTANTESDLSGYNVYQAGTAGGPYTQVNAVLVTDVSYVDTGLTNDVAYYYVVTAVDSSGNESLLSVEVNATPEDVTPPAAPTTLAAVAGENLVTLDWAANTETDLAGYNVYQAVTAGGPYTQVNAVLVTDVSYVDTGLTNDVAYYFVVTAVDSSGNESLLSAEVQCNTGRCHASRSTNDARRRCWGKPRHAGLDGQHRNGPVRVQRLSSGDRWRSLHASQRHACHGCLLRGHGADERCRVLLCGDGR